ncbi:MAG: exo-alpha-sialidase [Verrucomicrobia bacterium]|nr:exo-alpha-sialidase [Verrucomicrobiota bacterium]
MNKFLAGCVLVILTSSMEAAEDNIIWLVEYDGKATPQEQGWKPIGKLAASAQIVDGALRIADDSAEEMGAFRATWKPEPSSEVIVEARVRVEAVKGFRGGTAMWPSVEGAPVGLLVCDGRHQEGLVLRSEKITTFLDRVAVVSGRREFHTYRLVIREGDMSIFVDGELKIRGEGAFWKKAESPEGFVQFGSNSRQWKGDAYWESVKLGIRKVSSPPKRPRLRITIGEPWDIPTVKHDEPGYKVITHPANMDVYSVAPPKSDAPGYKLITPHSRPFVHDMGSGLLLMSVAQGPDAYYEPYSVLKSTDKGKTWQPVPGLQLKTFAPQDFVRLANGEILGVSRWNVKYAREDGIYIGMTYRFDAKAEHFTMFENKAFVPAGMGLTVIFDRDIFELANGDILAAVYGPTAEGGLNLDTIVGGGSAAPGAAKYSRYAFLVKSSDQGATWTHYSTLGPRSETSVVRFSDREMLAILKMSGWMPFQQVWSADAGKTWSSPIVMEECSVDPDMVYMTNGVLACSYGQPGTNLMFSLDKGKTWEYHRTISDKIGFNYTAIREVSPGRLLYVHDSPNMQALYVDVERLE